MTAAGDASGPPRPTFLLSSERSGSNLVRSILNTHSDVSAPHPYETAYPMDDLPSPAELGPAKRARLVRDVIVNKRYSFHPLTVPLDPERVAGRVERGEPTRLAIQRALYEESCEVEGTSLWSSKYPGLWRVLEEAFEYYDGLRVVYLVRDPRDVVLSFKNSNIEFYHPYFSANRWREEQERGLTLMEDRPGCVHLVRYEDLLQQPETEVAAICDFLRVPFEEAMLYYYETEDAKAASESSGLLENLQMPIKSDNYGKYRDALPEEEVLLTESIVREEMEQFGYEPEHGDEALDRFRLEEESVYESRDRELERRARIEHWRTAPREQVRRWLTTSFTAYMYLRYGVLA